MTRDEMIDAVEYLLDPTNPEWNQAIALWHLEKALPRIHVPGKVWHESDGRTAAEVVDNMIRAEAERAHEPAPPFITHKDLVNNVGFLQEERRNYGTWNMDVLVPLDLEFPRARLAEMIWETHTEASAEEIVTELYRRQGLDAPKNA